MKRRDFIKTGSAAGLGAGLTYLNFPVFGKNAPSNKIVLGVMGVNSRGNWLAQTAAKLPNTEIGYICDVEDGAIAKGMKAVTGAQSRTPTVIKDIRKLLEKKDFDALIVAAPDHWHAPAAIMGTAAGKHVYVEKPCAHNPHEGELLVAAAAKYNRHVQMGNQRRSWPNIQQAVKEVREGIIGDVYYARGWYVNDRKPIGTGKKIPVPGTLDWDLWQGPAPRKDYLDNIVHYNWHWRWHWGTSETCNNATHELDCMRWFLDVNFPTKVTSAGGRYAYPPDDWETPDTQTLHFEFENGKKAICWEGRSCHPYNLEGSGRGFTIFGAKGALYNSGGDSYKIIDGAGKVVKEVKQPDKDQRSVTNTISPAGEYYDAIHLQNFLDSIRGEAKLNAEINEGYRSTLLCLLGNIAQRTGRVLHTDPSNGHILADAPAMKLWSRDYEKGWAPKV
ncbi:putative dehydrogenase [Chitinophaga dinghuensis]|uniref:Putative dehydrogenase n=1 Tax=Chitinophaga dinghuensis TaxID=1539050 RepID=A0A327VK25_9BACT|nr:Gfo/Idh/MocA family oxidoreductase [Chitinophaga dinghuensis]RAJ75064.1 putative dehydrogenase [Chitinophaga dinghuensis]